MGDWGQRVLWMLNRSGGNWVHKCIQVRGSLLESYTLCQCYQENKILYAQWNRKVNIDHVYKPACQSTSYVFLSESVLGDISSGKQNMGSYQLSSCVLKATWQHSLSSATSVIAKLMARVFLLRFPKDTGSGEKQNVHHWLLFSGFYWLDRGRVGSGGLSKEMWKKENGFVHWFVLCTYVAWFLYALYTVFKQAQLKYHKKPWFS